MLFGGFLASTDWCWLVYRLAVGLPLQIAAPVWLCRSAAER